MFVIKCQYSSYNRGLNLAFKYMHKEAAIEKSREWAFWQGFLFIICIEKVDK